ncbi:MAG: hypothetical protein ACP5NV_05780 [Candidatus Woesearchaeota archaeon]
MITDTVSLIEILTKTDIEGYLFLKRSDTSQTVFNSDIKLITRVSSSVPVSNKTLFDGKYYLPRACVPKNANAIAHLTMRISENQFVHETYFCNLILRPDDGTRTLVYVEPHDAMVYKMSITFNPGVLDRLID